MTTADIAGLREALASMIEHHDAHDPLVDDQHECIEVVIARDALAIETEAAAGPRDDALRGILQRVVDEYDEDNARPPSFVTIDLARAALANAETAAGRRDEGLDVSRLARDFASSFVRIRGAHNPDPGEPCAWCRLAAEQAAEAVVTNESLRAALAKED